MLFEQVCVESVSHVLPDEVVSSAEIEQRLAPAYQRMRLPEGRLELMTGIRERRFFPAGTLPGDHSIRAGKRALAAAGLPLSAYGACLHGSVCRDCLEPATACRVHHTLGLPTDCVVQDLSNACLGVLSGMLHVSQMIELGQIDAGLVVGTEDGRELVDNTIDRLNTDESIKRDGVKPWFASLTIGSASAGVVLCHRRLSRTGRRLVAATVHAETQHHTLCRSEGLAQVMQTDSERLMHAGVAAGVANFDKLLTATGWQRDDFDRTVCHQVGANHRKLMLGELDLPIERDYATAEWLGNTGAAALPSAWSIAIERGEIGPTDRVGLLGIGSGVNCLMMAIAGG